MATFPVHSARDVPTTRLTIEYDGSGFRGWQIQPEGPTVQGELEAALSVALRQPVAAVGSGRTDAGVHARGQVAHIVTETAPDVRRLQAQLRGLLPPSIAVLDAAPAPDGFHARFDAVRRTYHYHVSDAARALDASWRVPHLRFPDPDVMNDAARAILGEHEFSSFCRTRSETTNRVCRVETARWVPEARAGDWRFEIAADRFVHGMVRAIVGTLLETGRGRRAVSDLPDILAARDRRAAGPAAAARGLVLHHVAYPA